MTRLAECRIDRDRLFSLFRRMVDIYSPSGKEEELGSFLADYLSGQGLPVLRQPVDAHRFNLLVATGIGEPDTLFLGHIDTVPAFDIEQYGFSSRNGVCAGLGTADMKSGCAAMIEAFVCAAETHRLPGSVLLALVVGEEETGDGTQTLLSSYRFREALVAEPTDLRPCFQHYGYIEMVLRAFGYRRHAAVSDPKTNAIRALLRLLLRLEDHIENEYGEIKLNIRDLHSSESGFAVPDRCTASLDLHLPPDLRADAFAAELRRFVERVLKESGTSRVDIEYPTLANGYRIDPETPLPKRLHEAYSRLGFPWAPDSFQSHSDANLLWDSGCRPVILGPGQLARAHTRDESVADEPVVSAAAIYASLLESFSTHTETAPS